MPTASKDRQAADPLADALCDIYVFIRRRQAEKEMKTAVADTFAGTATTAACTQADQEGPTYEQA
jgi:hypothetical protein